MQTIYYETEHFIRHRGNLVDLADYLQRCSAVSGGAPLSAPAETMPWPERKGEGAHLRLLPQAAPPSPRRRTARRLRRLRRAAAVLDLCASAAVVALALGALAAFWGL